MISSQLVFQAFGVEAFIDDHLVDVLLMLMLYGWAVIPLMYLLSFLFSSAATAFTRLTVFNMISGTATFLAVTIMTIPGERMQLTENFSDHSNQVQLLYTEGVHSDVIGEILVNVLLMALLWTLFRT